ncbi:TPA: hypothetical protein QDB10_003069 [Burkholderia vietnamiensis]|nr:hypothetical protein [Burkholderia vietnamiensis]
MKEPILSREQVLKIVRKTLKESNDRDKLSSDRFVTLASAFEEALLEKLCGEPVAWRDPKNTDPGQSVTFDAERAAKWAHIYREPLYALNRSKA